MMCLLPLRTLSCHHHREQYMLAQQALTCVDLETAGGATALEFGA